jgi:hypothetical protein
MNDLAARLAALDKFNNKPTTTTSANPFSLLAHPLLQWRFRQEREKWEAFVADLRDPDDGFFKEECQSFSMENREKLANAIEAALRGVDDDGETGTA